jgi:hypothetical protein
MPREQESVVAGDGKPWGGSQVVAPRIPRQVTPLFRLVGTLTSRQTDHPKSTVAPIDADSRERAARVKAAKRRRVALTRASAPRQ